MTPNILTVAGSDSGGGAGIQADLKTIMALGGCGLSVITALTAQNGKEVAGVHAPPAEFVVLQLTTVLEGFKVSAAKTGMLYSAEIIQALAPILEKRTYPLVVDPVCVSQSGSKLLAPEALEALKEQIIPQADVLTPNIPELVWLSGMEVTDGESAIFAADALLKLGAKAVLVKGGHMPSSGIVVNDILCTGTNPPKYLPQPRVDTQNNHGTGCTLSAAIATQLGFGMPLEVAITKSQRYLNLALRKSYNPGIGCGPVNHSAGLQIG